MSKKLQINKNIVYKTDEISKYFSENRTSFNSFYQSEKDILKTINWFPEISVLDVGCGCGGLGRALSDEFGVKNYIGIDINSQAIEMANKIKINKKFSFLNSDILSVKLEKLFDVVVSFSCVDWNVETLAMIKRCWSFVAPGGVFVATFRLADSIGQNKNKSIQYINYSGKKEGEVAPYKVFNYADLFKIFSDLGVADVSIKGYFLEPSSVAITEFEELFFCCVALQKI